MCLIRCKPYDDVHCHRDTPTNAIGYKPIIFILFHRRVDKNQFARSDKTPNRSRSASEIMSETKRALRVPNLKGYCKKNLSDIAMSIF